MPFPACPNCKSTHTYRSMRRGLHEGLVLRLRQQAPYRCRQCKFRFIATSRGWSRPGTRRKQSIATYLGLGRVKGGREALILVVVGGTVILGFLALLLMGHAFEVGEKVDSAARWAAPAVLALPKE